MKKSANFVRKFFTDFSRKKGCPLEQKFADKFFVRKKFVDKFFAGFFSTTKKSANFVRKFFADFLKKFVSKTQPLLNF